MRRNRVLIGGCVALALFGCAARSRSDAPAPSTAAPGSTHVERTTTSTSIATRSRCTRASSPAREASGSIKAIAARWLEAPILRRVAVGASVWVAGYGEILALEPDLALLPASNQKIFTAMGSLALFPRATVLTTSVAATAPVISGSIDGDLVLVGGGDPTLTARGPHSLDTLAARVRAAGITTVRGALIADESRYEPARRAPGWQTWHIPAYAGPLSALMVDDNRSRTDDAYIEDPALGNGQMFLDALHRAGIEVTGPVKTGVAPAHARVVASLASPTVTDLIGDMLLRSDNEIAEMLTREAGLRTTGLGSTGAGTIAFDQAIARFCAELRGVSTDGSGLSRLDRRSTREWRSLLQAAKREPWWSQFVASLPEAGRSGTLSGRFRGTAAEGNLHAKTGTIIGGRALSGYMTTAGGRDVVFSIVANGDAAGDVQPAIDSLLAALAADTS